MLFTAEMRLSNCGIGDNFATIASISKAVFRPLWTSFLRIRVGLSADISGSIGILM